MLCPSDIWTVDVHGSDRSDSIREANRIFRPKLRVMCDIQVNLFAVFDDINI